MLTSPTSDRLLDTRAAARRLGLSPGTLQNWRHRGQGPAYVRLGTAVRYIEGDLAEFIKMGRTARP